MNLEQSNPLVTVYIPTYNRVELLKRAVESVRQQTYQNLEIIIVDDCSKDSTHEYLDEISKQDSRIKYFIKEKNSGACVSRNIAIKNAKGDFITGLDDDDYFTLDRVEIFVKSWDSQNALLVGLCAPTLNSRISENRLLSKISYLFSVKNIKKRDMYFANYVGNQVFTRTKLLQNIGGFDEEFRAWQDFDTWFRLLELGYIKKTEKPTYFVDRSHEMGRITTNNVDKILEVKHKFIEKHNVRNRIYVKALNNHLYTYDHTKVLFTDVLVKFIFQYSDIKYNLRYIFDFFYKKIKN